MKKLTSFRCIIIYFSCLLIVRNDGASPSERLCANEDCSAPISRAKTLVRYVAPREGRASFPKGVDVEVFSKHENGWGIKYGNQIGQVPPSFLREYKMYIHSNKLMTVTNNVATEPGKVEMTQNESDDLIIEKTKEIPSSIGSMLSFPSLASAESFDGQGAVLTPSSPQYEVVAGTTIWNDPVPTGQGNQQPLPYSGEHKEHEKPVVPGASLEVPQNVEPTKVHSLDMSSETETSADVTMVPDSKVPVTPIPYDNFVTPPSVNNLLDIPQTAETSTEKSVEAAEELMPQSTIEVPLESSSEAPERVFQETTVDSLQEAKEASPEDVTEPQDIQPTEAGIMSNIWNTMFNSGDGTEENSQENEGEEEGEDEEEDEEGDEGVEEDGEDSTEEGSTTASPVPSASETPTPESQETFSTAPLSAEDAASDIVTENISQMVTAEDLAASFPNIPSHPADEKMRLPRQSNLDSEEVTSGEIGGSGGELISGEESASKTPDVGQQSHEAVDGAQNKDQKMDDEKLKLEEEDKLKKAETEALLQQEDQKRLKEEELKVLQEEELKRQQEEEQKQMKEEEQKRIDEEQERIQAEEQKRLEEELLRQEEKRRQEEILRMQQEEETKRQQEEATRLREEENRKTLEAEQELFRRNQEIQRQQEEEAMKLREETKRQQETLRKEKEQIQVIEKVKQTVTEEPTIEQVDLPADQLVDPPTYQPMDQAKDDFVDQTAGQDVAKPEEENTSEGMFSWFSGLFGSNPGAASNESEQAIALEDSQQYQEAQQESSQQPSPPEHQPSHQHASVWSSAHQTMCAATETGCDMTDGNPAEMETGSFFMGIQIPSLDVILLRLTATAVALCMGAFSFYLLRKKHVDSSLVAQINELEKQLLVASKEAVILREEADTVDASANSEEVRALREELESYHLVKADLEEQVSTLERELEEATETGIELNKLLSETLEASKGKAHAGLAASVERLQQQLDSQKDKVDSLTRSLKSTSAENENLKSLLAEGKERLSAVEAELAAAAEVANNIRREKEEAKVSAAQELQQVQARLEEALSSKVLEESRLGSELSSLKLKHETLRSTLNMKEAEIKALQSTLRELESGSISAEELLNVTKTKAEFVHAQQEKDSYEKKYLEEEKIRKNLEDQFEKTAEIIKTLEEKADIAEKNKEEAETRLAVLSNYFKEKEEQLQKELGLKEAIVAQHQGDESTVVKHLQLLQEEVSTYRSQNESLKKEILDQERDFKGQIATLEKKAHDNWMTARQAERRLDDSRQEGAQLRNRLTLIEKSNADPNTRLDANGDGGVVSPVMMMPLPPLGDLETPPPLPPFMFSPPPYPPPFMPGMPPPLPPHPMGRPPPLGRMSSPPPPLGQFSPPPPPYDRMDRSSRSPSPPPHRYHHRSPPPPQWDGPPSGFRPSVSKPSPKKPSEQRDLKGSMHSSGHSSESMDKSREHV